MRHWPIYVAVAALLLAACQHTTQSAGPGAGASATASAQRTGTLADRMEALLERGNSEGAMTIYDQNVAALSLNPGPTRDLLQRVAAARAAQLRDRTVSVTEWLTAATWPGEPAQWANRREQLQAAADALRPYAMHHLFNQPGFDPPERLALVRARAEAREQCEEALGPAIEQAGIAALPRYPLKTTLSGFMLAHPEIARRQLAALSELELAAQIDRNRDDLTAAQVRELETLLQARASGATPVVAQAAPPRDAAPYGKVTFIDLSSPALVRRGAIQFPVKVDVDLPVTTVGGQSLEAALDDPASGAADLLVVVNVVAARAERDIARYEKVQSEYQTATRRQPNPRYAEIQEALAYNRLQLLRLGERSPAFFGESTWREVCRDAPLLANRNVCRSYELKDAIERLSRELANTEAVIDEPVYAAYEFRKADIESRKDASVRLHIVDRRGGRYMKDTVDLTEVKRFTVPYLLSEHDRYRQRHLSGLSSEDDVVAFERAGITVKLSDILDSYRKGGAKADVPDRVALRKALLAERNAALRQAEKQVYTVKSVAGARAPDAGMEGIVAVYTPNGDLGSGFYVRDDLVLTNEHVVEGSQFAELKRHDGVETFGKVIATDPRRDLALIQVQARGQPLRFYAGRDLPLGGTVIAIGHPKGLEFTVTRGVISAVRPMPSLGLPGADRMLFIQTDTAINAGNSGGPLLLDGRVIGVNTWKMVMTDVEGLSFSLHFSEVFDFLRKHGAMAEGGG